MLLFIIDTADAKATPVVCTTTSQLVIQLVIQLPETTRDNVEDERTTNLYMYTGVCILVLSTM